MSSKYQQIEVLLRTIKCGQCGGAGSAQYAASSPTVKCEACKGSGFAKGAGHGISMITDALYAIKLRGEST